MLPGPEEGREVHGEGEHGAERADHQRDQPGHRGELGQPGHRGEPREAAGKQGCRRDGKKCPIPLKYFLCFQLSCI